MTDVAADIADMEMALQAAKRPKVRAILSEYLQQLKAEQALRDGSAVPHLNRSLPQAKVRQVQRRRPDGIGIKASGYARSSVGAGTSERITA